MRKQNDMIKYYIFKYLNWMIEELEQENKRLNDNYQRLLKEDNHKIN